MGLFENPPAGGTSDLQFPGSQTSHFQAESAPRAPGWPARGIFLHASAAAIPNATNFLIFCLFARDGAGKVPWRLLRRKKLALELERVRPGGPARRFSAPEVPAERREDRRS